MHKFCLTHLLKEKISYAFPKDFLHLPPPTPPPPPKKK